MSVTLRLMGAAVLALLVGSTARAAGPLEFPVTTGHLRHGSSGTLVFDDKGVEYKTAKKGASRRWTYEQIKQVQVRTPKRVVIRTYEDKGFFKWWTDRDVQFDVLKGEITPELSAFLLTATPRPVLMAVLPPATGRLRYQVPVKHLHARTGETGDLLLYDNALVYRTARPGESRYWRFEDLASAFATDRFRLSVLTYEGGGGDTKSFEFQLRSDLPSGFFDALWSSMNVPAPLHGGTRGAPEGR